MRCSTTPAVCVQTPFRSRWRNITMASAKPVCFVERRLPHRAASTYTSVMWALRTMIADRPGDAELLRRWGHRVGSNARDAIHLAEHLARFIGHSSQRSAAVVRYYHADTAAHSFNVEPHHWLRLTEVQITTGLAGFLGAGGGARILAFLRALVPDRDWPAALDRPLARSEVPAGNGRIDLILSGHSGGRVWGAVVEAKLGHHARDNPLQAYRGLALSSRMSLVSKDGIEPTAALRIVGQNRCRSTQHRLAMNKDWSFVDWQTLLRRFEHQLRDLDDDIEFRRFRRTLWERVR